MIVPGPIDVNGTRGDGSTLAPPAHEDGVVPVAIAAASNAMGGRDKAGRAQLWLERPLRAHRPYGERTVGPQRATGRPVGRDSPIGGAVPIVPRNG